MDYIKAMSMDQKLAESKLLRVVDPLTDHLIKLYVFPNTDYVLHWRKEVWNFLNKVPRLKATNKFPSFEWMFEILSSYLDMTDQIMWQIVDEYAQHIPVRLDPEELESILTEYFT